MAPSDQIILNELVAISGEFAKMTNQAQTIVEELKELNQFLSDSLQRMKSTN